MSLDEKNHIANWLLGDKWLKISTLKGLMIA